MCGIFCVISEWLKRTVCSAKLSSFDSSFCVRLCVFGNFCRHPTLQRMLITPARAARELWHKYAASYGICFSYFWLLFRFNCCCFLCLQCVQCLWVFLPSSSWFMLVISFGHKSVCTFPSCLHHPSDCLRLCLFLSVFPVLWLPAPPALFSSMFKPAPGLRRYFETSTNQR